MNDLASILEHLQHLVAFYPVTSKQENVKDVLEYCQRKLRATGTFDDSAIVMHNGVYSLRASTQATKHPKVLLQGHIDVVPAPPTIRHLTRHDDKVVGRGVFDMLFATACYIHFIEKYREQLGQLDIGVMLTGDEEQGGFHSVPILLNDGYGADVCILPDGGDSFGEFNMASKGFYIFSVTTQGIAHHSAYPHEGKGGADKLVALLQELMTIFPFRDEEDSSMAITHLRGGEAINMTPDHATAYVDMRFKNPREYETVKEPVQKICQKYQAAVKVFAEHPGFQTDLKNPYITSFLALYEKSAGKPITFQKSNGTSDARYFGQRGIPVIGLRPDGGDSHGDQEYLSTASLEKFYALLEEYLLKTATIKLKGTS